MSIQCRDSNSRPLEHESPPITTRPGLLPEPSALLYLSYLSLPILLKAWMLFIRLANCDFVKLTSCPVDALSLSVCLFFFIFAVAKVPKTKDSIRYQVSLLGFNSKRHFFIFLFHGKYLISSRSRGRRCNCSRIILNRVHIWPTNVGVAIL